MDKQKPPDLTDPDFFERGIEKLIRQSPELSPKQKKELREIGQQAKKASENIGAQSDAAKPNSRQSIKITPEQCGEMLYDWLRLHCNSKAMKTVSKDVGYRYSIISPSKKVHLMEELVFLYISLAICEVNVALDDISTIGAVVDAFLAKMRNPILNTMASDDAGFQKRYSERVGSYYELLRSGGDAIGVAGIFLEGLFGTPDARLKLQPSIKVSTSVVKAQNLLRKSLQQLEIFDDNDI